MLLYEIGFDLKPGVSDLEMVQAFDAYMERLRAEGLIAQYRLTRRALGLGPKELGEFRTVIELDDLSQLDRVFKSVSERIDPLESLHHGLNRLARNLTFSLSRDFPDPHRKTGQERF